jgi:hypothetical protein
MMERTTAKALIKAIIENGLHAHGIVDNPPELHGTLADFMEANSVIEQENEKAKTGPAPYTISMTVDERGLAAMYTATSFEGGTPDNPTIAGYANGNYVLVISKLSMEMSGR